MLYVRLGKSLRAISQCISNEDYTDVWTTNTVIVDKHEVPCRSVVAETAERPSSSFNARDMRFPMAKKTTHLKTLARFVDECLEFIDMG